MKIQQIVVIKDYVHLVVMFNELHPHRCRSVTFRTFAKIRPQDFNGKTVYHIASKKDVDKGFIDMMAYRDHLVDDVIEHVNKFLEDIPEE